MSWSTPTTSRSSSCSSTWWTIGWVLVKPFWLWHAGPLLYQPVRDGKDIITLFVLISKVESPGCIHRVQRYSNPDFRPHQHREGRETYLAAHIPGRYSHIVSIKIALVTVKSHGTTTITVRYCFDVITTKQFMTNCRRQKRFHTHKCNLMKQ